MEKVIRSKRELLLERIHRLEKFIIEQDDDGLKKIHQEHLQFLREELAKCGRG